MKSVIDTPYAMTVIPVGTTTVTAVPSDYAGNMGQEVAVTITTTSNGRPAVAIVSPQGGAAVGTGQSVSVAVEASDDLGLKEIEMRVRGVDVSLTQVRAIPSGILTTAQVFAFSVPATAKPANNITVEAVARDTRGLESPPVAIVLHAEDRTPPSARITSFTGGFHVTPGQTVPVTVHASDNLGLARIDFWTEGGLVVSDSRTVAPAAGDSTVTFNLAIPVNYVGGTRITVAASATDSSGNVGYAPKITLIADDTTPPTVEIVAPAGGSSVTPGSTVTFSARATDNDAVDRVEFFVDGVLLATDTASANGIYDASFIVSASAGATVSLSAKSYDKSGNVSAPASMTLNVIRDTAPPVIAITSPPVGTTPTLFEGETLHVRGTAVDDYGLAKVELLVNGSPVTSTTVSPFDLAYAMPNDGTPGTDNLLALVVRATDMLGNTSEAQVRVRVVQDNPPQVSFVTPRPNAVVIKGSTIPLSVTATDDRAIREVRFYDGATLLGSGTASGTTYLFAYNVPNVTQSETRVLKAEAVDATGQTAVAETSIVINDSAGRVVANIPLGGYGQAVDVSGNVAVVGESNGVLSVFDVTDPLAPVKRGSVNVVSTWTLAMQVRIMGSRVYAATGVYVAIVDIGNSAQPTVLKVWYPGCHALSVDVNDDIAHVGTSCGRVYVYDVRDGQNPVSKFTKDLQVGLVTDVRVDGLTGRLYAAVDNGSNSYLSVLDTRDIVNLGEIGRVAVPGSPRRLEVVGDKVYIAAKDRVVVVSLSRLGTIAFGGDSTRDGIADDVLSAVAISGGSANDIDVAGGYAYVADSLYGGLYNAVKVLDVADPAAPVEVGAIETSGDAVELEVWNGYVYVADGAGGFSVLESYLRGAVAPSLELDLVGIVVDPAAMSVSVVGAAGAVADNAYPVNVRVTSTAMGRAYETVVSAADHGAFRVTLPWVLGDELSISLVESTPNPVTTAPVSLGVVAAGRTVGNIPLGGYGQAVDVSGNVAVVGESNGVLSVFDVTDPLAPVKRGSVNVVSTWTSAMQVRIMGSRVYAATGVYVAIVDIGNSAQPTVLKVWYPGCHALSVDVNDDIAHVGTSCGRVYVYDVRDGQNPVSKFTKDLQVGLVTDVRVDGLTGRLYAAVDNGSNSYLSVLDTRDIVNLGEIGRVAVPGSPRRLEVVGDKVYIAAKDRVVVVSLSRLGTIAFGGDSTRDGIADDVLSAVAISGGSANDIDVAGGYAYVADSLYGGLYNAVKVLDVADPAAPVEVGAIETSGDAVELEVWNGYVYVADGAGGFSVLESYLRGAVAPSLELDLVGIVVDPAAMSVSVVGAAGAVADNAYPVNVRVTSTAMGRAYETVVSAADHGAFRVTLPWVLGDELSISLVESTPNPVTTAPVSLGVVAAGRTVGNIPLGGYGQAVDVSGNVAVVGESNGVLSVFDVTDPLAPVKRGSVNVVSTWTLAMQVRIMGSRVYAATGVYVAIVDIGNSAQPTVLKVWYPGCHALSVDVNDDIAHVGTSCGRVYVYDVRDGQNPVSKFTKDLQVGLVTDVRVDGLTGRLYAAVDNGSNSYLSVLDTRDIVNLGEIGRVAVPGSPRRLEVVGDKVYIAAKDRVVVVSLSRLGTIAFGGDSTRDGIADDVLSAVAISGGSANDIDVAGGYAYVADSLYGGLYNAVKVLDVADPAAPVEVGAIETSGDAVELEVWNGYVYVADGAAGLSVIDPVAYENLVPVANAGPDQAIQVGAEVTLNGSASSDADGDLLRFSWTLVSKPTGSAAIITSPFAAKPIFTPDIAGMYSVQLIVSDGKSFSLPDTVSITASTTSGVTNAMPVAFAGSDQEVDVGGTVFLDGIASYDPDGDRLTYQWSFLSMPQESFAWLSDESSPSPSFVVDWPGTYTLQLIVSDGRNSSEPDTVNIITQNTPPVAHAGFSQTVLVGETVMLNGSGSYDPDGDPLTYQWSLASKPTGSVTVLSDVTAVRPTFVADRAGTYVIQLIVSDGTDSSTAHVTITATQASTTTGSALLWGWNIYGQLGDGTTNDRYSPQQATGLTGVIATAAAGVYHSMAVTEGGTVAAWGGNQDGQLGDGTTTTRTTPAVVNGIVDVAVLSAGAQHSLALKSDGTVWAWGYNGYGQLGDGTTTTRTMPVKVSSLNEVLALTAGFGHHSIALKSDATVWAWGYNAYGMVGDGTVLTKTTPVQVSEANDVVAVSAGAIHSAALKSDGTVWSWGHNGSGQLGVGFAVSQSATPLQVPGLSGIVAVSAGSYRTFALKSDGTLWAWGNNACGSLGDGSQDNRDTPVQVVGLTNVIAVSGGWNHTIALKNDGTVWSWGCNNYGQLGVSTAIPESGEPIQVPGLTDVFTISAGAHHNVVLKNQR